MWMTAIDSCVAPQFGWSRSDRVARSSLGPGFAELPVQQVFSPWHAFVFEQLNVLLDAAIEREADLPRPRVDVWILDRRLVHHVIRADRGIALDDVEFVAVIVASA